MTPATFAPYVDMLTVLRILTEVAKGPSDMSIAKAARELKKANRRPVSIEVERAYAGPA